MYDSKGFSKALRAIKVVGAKLDTLVKESIEFCTYHSVVHDNHEPWGRLMEAAPAYARGIIRASEKEARTIRVPVALGEATAEKMAAPAAEKLAERRSSANKRKKAPAEASAPVSPVSPVSDEGETGETEMSEVVAAATLTSREGHKQILSQEEYEMVCAYLIQIRTKDKVAAA